MRAIVDSAICIGCTLCTQMCPEIFRMEGDKAMVDVDPIPVRLEDDCRQGVQQCPVGAIKIQKESQ